MKYRKNLMGDVLKCPFCTSINKSKKICEYPGSFLNCDELLQCLECELIFASPLPLRKELNDFYTSGLYCDKISNPFSKEFLKFSLNLAKSRLRLISNCVNLASNLKVIDIGAGNAQFAMALNDIVEEFVYDAVEPDESIANQYGKLVNHHFNEIHELEKNNYDLAILNQVLEHVSDSVVFLSSVAELIKPQGYVYIDVPYQDYIYKPSVEPHVLFWSQKSITLLAEKTGFKVLFCETAGMPHHLAQRFFHPQTVIQKLSNPWIYQEKINNFFRKSDLPKPFNTFRLFQSDCYGGDRQWLRCIAQKLN